eukprot:jgi/Botrbrau1/369/Bobra.110_2s0025.1
MQALWSARSFVICVSLWAAHSVFCKRDIDIVLEHDLNGQFVRGGRIFGTLNPLGTSTIKLQRDEWGYTEKEYFSNLVTKNGFYRLKLPSSAGIVPQPLLFSVPARCLAGVKGSENIRVQVTDDGLLVGVSYDLGSLACNGEANDAVKDWSPPLDSNVAVTVPRPAPEVSVEPTPMFAGSQQSTGLGSAGGRSAPLGQQAESSQEGSEGSSEGEQAPRPDERTWFQKNWIFVVPVAMLVMNVAGAMFSPPQGPEGRAGPGGNGNARPAQPRPRQR